MAALMGMVDELHEDCAKRRQDENHYIFGCMAKHNCVLACLPAGVYGTTSATSVASDMRFSFPCIEFWLLVGIGGGVPGSSLDIRLGDVVVGIPSPERDAVVQYEHGKALAEERFIRTGSMNKPPVSLLTAVSRLQAETRAQQQTLISDLVLDMIARHPEMGHEYSYPGPDRDVLFQAEYQHAGGTDCKDCDLGRAMQRQPRNHVISKVHYGPIASGNRVIKHAFTRDKMAQELGVICFEMEAAGLAGFPFLCIRGICDYADSHKNKEWQGYSSATAAAYVKILLGIMTSNRPLSASNRTADDHTVKEKIIIASLHFDQLQSRQHTIRGAHARTCKWFTQHDTYQYWLDSSQIAEHSGFLWIKGKPGTGKSTLMKYALEDAHRSRGKEAAIISFFFNARGETLERSTTGMYRSLLWQLLTLIPDTRRPLNSISDPSGMVSDTLALQDLFINTIQILGSRQLIIFIDALDECQEEEVREMVDFFGDLNDLAQAGSRALHICFSSRHYPHITFNQGLEMVLERQAGHDGDLKSYINNKLSYIRDKQIEDVKTGIFQKASGIFLWVVLVVDILRKAYDHGRMNAVRRRLNEVPPKLSDLFKDMLMRDNENIQDLFICLQWILFSKRPLSPHELFLAIQAHGETELQLSAAQPTDDDWLLLSRGHEPKHDPGLSISPSEKDDCETEPHPSYCDDVVEKFLLSASKGLAEITKSRKSPAVQFIHESVREFLVKDNGLDGIMKEMNVSLPYTKNELLKWGCLEYIKASLSCLLCLSGDHRELPQAKSSKAAAMRNETSNSFPFLVYAVSYVLEHADESAAEGVSQMDFVKCFPRTTWVYTHNLYEKHQVRRYSNAVPLLYVFADRDLPNLISTALAQELSYTSSDERQISPIVRAIDKGNLRAVKAFLYSKKEHRQLASDLKNLYLLQVPSHASVMLSTIRKGKPQILKSLLEAGAICLDTVLQLTTPNVYGHSLLSYAIQEAKNEIVKMLIEFGVDVNMIVNTPSHIHASPLHVALASKNGNIENVKALIKAGANVNQLSFGRGDDRNCPPLHWAIDRADVEAVEILLDAGAAPESVVKTYSRTHTYSKSALLAAVSKDQEDIVSLLLRAGADPDGNVSDQALDGNSHCETPLHIAVVRGNRNIIALLGKRGANLNAPYPEDCETIDILSSEHREIMVPDIPIADYAVLAKHSPLYVAMAYSIGVVSCLVDAGASLNSYDTSNPIGFLSPMFLAFIQNRDEMLRWLLQPGSFGVPYRALSPLHFAIMDGKTQTVEWLVELDGDLSAMVGSGYVDCDAVFGRPLSHAARLGQVQMVRALIRRGDHVNEETPAGEGPPLVAAIKGTCDHDTLRVLIDSGAQANLTVTLWNNLLSKLPLGYSLSCRLIQDILFGAAASHTETLLSSAIEHRTTARREELIRLLVKGGVDVRGINSSPLHLAARVGDVSTIKLLLDSGAYPDVCDEVGNTPLVAACKMIENTEESDRNQAEIISILLAHEGDTCVERCLPLVPFKAKACHALISAAIATKRNLRLHLS
ncbi:ankyrin repeat-containing domain protein [Aspergillus pseudoustus]|uniref:Ankyrin repeat-containing domain protein n=1 Tax=Aspergillus pseudoustus TaxID=1810923 RepID=A0ABR4KDE5_9EURO